VDQTIQNFVFSSPTKFEVQIYLVWEKQREISVHKSMQNKEGLDRKGGNLLYGYSECNEYLLVSSSTYLNFGLNSEEAQP
jgi:hypothetical protein